MAEVTLGRVSAQALEELCVCPSGNSACKQGPCWWLGGGAALAPARQRRQASRTRPRQAPFLQPARHDSSTGSIGSLATRAFGLEHQVPWRTRGVGASQVASQDRFARTCASGLRGGLDPDAGRCWIRPDCDVGPTDRASRDRWQQRMQA